MTVKEKRYNSPTIEVVILKTTDILCQSNASLLLSDDGKVTKGNDGDWGSNLDW